jgi:UDPglucose 6-dehydrogenase
VTYAETPLAACQGADALLIATEWAQYREADLEAVGKALKARRIFDGRNLFRPEAMEAQGWTYHSLGRRAVVSK